MPQAPQLPKEVYGAFCSAINQDSVQRIIANFAIAMNGKVQKVHLFFQSSGGTVGDGIALYNYFKALPLDLTIYNPGGVFSIATIAYLGAKKRKASAHAMFGLHRTTGPAVAVESDKLKTLAEAAAMDDQRTQAIIREHTKLPPAKWEQLNKGELFFPAAEAVEYGIADEIADFSPPVGTAIFNI